LDEKEVLLIKIGERFPVQGTGKSLCLSGYGGEHFLGLEQKWFDKKNSKWLKSSKIRGNLNSKGGSVHGKTG